MLLVVLAARVALTAVVPLGVGATQARVEAEWPKTMAEAMAIFILLSACVLLSSHAHTLYREYDICDTVWVVCESTKAAARLLD